jgi:hypothetical protein
MLVLSGASRISSHPWRLGGGGNQNYEKKKEVYQILISKIKIVLDLKLSHR